MGAGGGQSDCSTLLLRTSVRAWFLSYDTVLVFFEEGVVIPESGLLPWSEYLGGEQRASSVDQLMGVHKTTIRRL